MVVKRLALVALPLLALLTAAPSGAAAAQCGLPDGKPLWLEYAEGSVTFRQDVFGKPGIIAATSGVAVPQALRAGGAQTVYWEMKLGSIAGTTTAPADPAMIFRAAQKLFDKAAASSGCATPLIAINELNGASTTTPWTVTNSRYRQNVLDLLRALAERGARPFLLVSAAPYTGGEAADWWRQVAQVGDIVPEVYFNAPAVSKLGPVLGSRRMRAALRSAIAAYTAIGIPVSRLGFVLGFQSGPNTGGREGLQPSSAWFGYVKLYTLAAKQIAAEFGVATVWSWGWGTFSAAGADPDKPAAACVYLWVRDAGLCDGPAAAGEGFEPSLAEGQINLPAGVQCDLGGRVLLQDAIARLTSVTRDREVAVSILFGRLVETEGGAVPLVEVVAAEQAIVRERFGGDRSAYLRAIAKAHATLNVARAVIADELLRAKAEAATKATPPTGAQIAAFYQSYPEALVRAVRAKPAPRWLGNRRQGFALAAASPETLFRLPAGIEATLATSSGSYAVTPLDEPLPLGALPLELARPAIRAALIAFARSDAYDRAARKRQEQALNRTVCLRDDLPSVGVVPAAAYLPFLALDP